MIGYLMCIEGKRAPAVFTLPFVRQNRPCHFMDHPGTGQTLGGVMVTCWVTVLL